MIKKTYLYFIVSTILVGFMLIQAQTASAQTMTLEVPYRDEVDSVDFDEGTGELGEGPLGEAPGVMQTASTDIEFDASSIAADAEITVDGATVGIPESACSGSGCSSTPQITDSEHTVTAKRYSGTDRVLLTLTYLGSFDSANFCEYTVPESAKIFDIELTGFDFSGGAGYRISSYMVPGAPFCNFAYVRVPTAYPSFSDAGSVDKLGTLPMNVVFVVDKSGSMDDPIPGSTDIRWNRLKSSVESVTTTWEAIGAGASSEGSDRDRLGLVFFDSNAHESPLDAGSFFKLRDNDDEPWRMPISSALDDTSPGGTTSIGAGIQLGRERLDDVDAVNGDTAIILFTDGEQNRSPCVLHEGGTVSSLCNESFSGTPEDASLTLEGDTLVTDVDPDGPIFTIGFGEGGIATSAKLLDEISRETAGRMWFADNGTSMDTSFVDSLVSNLKGGTVSLLNRTVDTISPSSSGSSVSSVDAAPSNYAGSGTNSIAIDASITRAVFMLSWNGQSREISLELRGPDGTVVRAPFKGSGSHFRVKAVDIPSTAPAGVWQARVLRHGPTGEPFEYQLSTYGVENRLTTSVVESRYLGTGNSIKIAAQVGWDNTGLDKLPPGAVQAVIGRPKENLGTILHKNRVKAAYRQDKDSSPLMSKINYLAQKDKLLKKVGASQLPDPVPLENVGDGRYVGTFDATRVGGNYSIRVEFDWDDPRTGRIKRTEYIEREVPVIPSGKHSEVAVQRDPNSGKANVRVTPQDKFGNFVGPGYKGSFDIRVGDMKKPITVQNSDLDGSYDFRLTDLSPDADPNVIINYSGITVRDAPLSKLEEPYIPGGENGKCSGPCCKITKGETAGLGASAAFIGLMGFVLRRRRRKNNRQ